MVSVLHYYLPVSITSDYSAKVWQINRSANRLFILSTNLDGFNLANHGQFAKFAKVSHYTVLPLIMEVLNLWRLNIICTKNFPQVNFPPHATKSLCSKIVYKCAVNRMSLCAIR